MHVSDLYHACPVPVKCPNSLHVLVLSHETCMVNGQYALQDQATSMQEITWDLAVLKHTLDLHVSGTLFEFGNQANEHAHMQLINEGKYAITYTKYCRYIVQYSLVWSATPVFKLKLVWYNSCTMYLDWHALPWVGAACVGLLSHVYDWYMNVCKVFTCKQWKMSKKHLNFLKKQF